MKNFPDKLDFQLTNRLINGKVKHDDVLEVIAEYVKAHSMAERNAEMLNAAVTTIKRLEAEISLLKANVLSLEDQVDDAYRQMSYRD